MGRRYHYYGGLAVGVLLAGAVGGFLLTPYFKGDRPINPVLLEIGGVSLYWYGLTMFLAVLVAFLWWQRRSFNLIGPIHQVNLVTWLVITGLIGARLLFVLLKLPEFLDLSGWEMLNLRSGGLSIHGALIGGSLATFIYARRYRLPILKTFDLLVPPLIVGQIIGRLGNFFNQEAFGGPTNLPWKMWVAPEFRPVPHIDQQFFHPTFLYSMIGMGIVLLIVLWVERRWQQPGTVLLAYTLVYGVERWVIELFRVDSSTLWGWTWAQWGSLAIIITSVVIGLIWKSNYRHRS